MRREPIGRRTAKAAVKGREAKADRHPTDGASRPSQGVRRKPTVIIYPARMRDAREKRAKPKPIPPHRAVMLDDGKVKSGVRGGSPEIKDVPTNNL